MQRSQRFLASRRDARSVSRDGQMATLICIYIYIYIYIYVYISTAARNNNIKRALILASTTHGTRLSGDG